MNKKLVIGIIALFVVSVGLFIAGVNRIIHPAFSTLGLVVAPIGVWIYLVWMVRKKKTGIFHDQMEPKLAERRLKWLKTFLLVGPISLAVGIVGAILHNVISALSGEEEAVFFFIALLAIFVWIIATVSGLVIFLIGRRKPN